MKRHHKIKNLKFEGEVLFLTIDGKDKKFHLNEVSSVLEKATEKERNVFELAYNFTVLRVDLICLKNLNK